MYCRGATQFLSAGIAKIIIISVLHLLSIVKPSKVSCLFQKIPWTQWQLTGAYGIG